MTKIDTKLLYKVIKEAAFELVDPADDSYRYSSAYDEYYDDSGAYIDALYDIKDILPQLLKDIGKNPVAAQQKIRQIDKILNKILNDV